MRTLLSTTVHTATDYGLAAWLSFDPPTYFTNHLSTIDNTSARAALGALPTTPKPFLQHDMNLSRPETRLKAKVMNFIAKALTKPSHHPLFSFIQQAQTTNPKNHRNIFHQFFQHDLGKEFDEFTTQLPVDPTAILSRPDNYSTIIQEIEEVAIQGTKQLKHSKEHLIIYTDGSRIPTKNTTAAAWCQNTNNSLAQFLGKARLHGIYQAEYKGVHLGLTMAMRTATQSTKRISIILDNQSVIKDLTNCPPNIASLLDRKETFKILKYIKAAFENARVTIRWCPGHCGVRGNEIVDKMANNLAKRELPSTFTSTPTLSGFTTAIKAWSKLDENNYSPQDIKRLGHQPSPQKHLRALSQLQKHKCATITQLRSNHIHLNSYLFKHQQRFDPLCDCQEGIETIDHFLFICHRYTKQRRKLTNAIKELQLNKTTDILNNPKIFENIAKFCNSTWRLKSRWVWAKITEETVPQNFPNPTI